MNVFERIYDCNGEIGFKKIKYPKTGRKPSAKSYN